MLCIWEEQLFPAAFSLEWSCIGRVLIAFLEIKAAGTGAVCWSLLPPGAAHQPALPSHPHREIPQLEGCLSPGTPRPLRAFPPFHSLIPLAKREVLQRQMLLWRIYLMPMLGTNPGKTHSNLAGGRGGGAVGCRVWERNGEMGRLNV